jgi:hypothetical protein
MEVEISGINAGFCKFAKCKCVEGKVKWHTHSIAEGKACALFLNNVLLVMISDWLVVFAEGEVR